MKITNLFSVPMESPRLGITIGPGETVTIDDAGRVISTEPAAPKPAPKPTTKPKPAQEDKE